MGYALITYSHKYPVDVQRVALDFTNSVGQIMTQHGLVPLGGVSITSTPDEIIILQAMIQPGDIPTSELIVEENGSVLH